jgi:putative membrane protein
MRRLTLSAVALAFTMPCIALPAAAQNASGSASEQNPSSSASEKTGNKAAAMGEAEAKHAADTTTVGLLALQTSQIALKKAQNPKVKEFAQLEVAEQETIADVLKSMRDQSTPASGQVKAPTADTVQSNLDAKGKAMVEKLQKAEAGAAFDREYVQGQIEGHQQLLEIQEAYLKTGKDRENLNVTKLMRGQIQEHLTLLQDMQKHLGRS